MQFVAGSGLDPAHTRSLTRLIVGRLYTSLSAEAAVQAGIPIALPA
ncbi:MAG: hypothetical protein JNM78_13265 [Cyclobacteriaceae bacterium]|nr:hypothetical protein [Cyclobacteriaceae bacterium]